MWEFSLIHRPVLFAHGVTEENSTLEETQYQFYANASSFSLKLLYLNGACWGKGQCGIP